MVESVRRPNTTISIAGAMNSEKKPRKNKKKHYLRKYK
jgi:hypothetical protein